jgi:hypothetical protein
MEEREKA